MDELAYPFCRFIHVRHLHLRHEVIDLIEALTGHAFVPETISLGRYILQMLRAAFASGSNEWTE
jgi:hypothetical protein